MNLIYQNHVLFNENEHVNELFFIKEGELELSINVNLDGLNELVNRIISKTKLRMKEFKKINEESIFSLI